MFLYFFFPKTYSFLFEVYIECLSVLDLIHEVLSMPCVCVCVFIDICVSVYVCVYIYMCVCVYTTYTDTHIR